MKKKSKTGELFDRQSLFTHGGASLAVVTLTNVLGSSFGLDINDKYKWIGLIVSLLIAFVGTLKDKKIDFTLVIVAFFNGLLIFTSATGLNTINHSATFESNSEVKKGKLIGFGDETLWWEPQVLLKEIEHLEHINDSTLLVYENMLEAARDSSNYLKVITNKLSDSLAAILSLQRYSREGDQNEKLVAALSEVETSRMTIAKLESKARQLSAKMDSLKKVSQTAAESGSADQLEGNSSSEPEKVEAVTADLRKALYKEWSKENPTHRVEVPEIRDFDIVANQKLFIVDALGNVLGGWVLDNTIKKIHNISKDHPPLHNVVISKDEKYLIFFGVEDYISVMNAKAYEEEPSRIDGHSGGMGNGVIVYLPDKIGFFSAADDKRLLYSDMKTTTEVFRSEEQISSLAYNERDEVLYFSTNSEVSR